MDISDRDGLDQPRALARGYSAHPDQRYPFTARVAYHALYTEGFKVCQNRFITAQGI